MNGLCYCGCGQKTNIAQRTDRSKNWIKGKPLKYIHNHKTLSLIDYIVDKSTGCWIWQKHITKYGYGIAPNSTGRTSAHRAMYERYKGIAPAGSVIHHKCHNRKCVNPEHLEAVTRIINAREGDSTKLTHHQTKQLIFEVKQGNKTKTAIAHSFNVSPQNISDIIYGRSWKEMSR